MSKPRKPPELANIGGVWHKCTVAKIVSRDEQGRPWEVELLYDDQSTEIVGGEAFMTLYVRRDMMKAAK